MAAMFDPQKANDDQYYRIYRQIIDRRLSSITPGKDLKMRIEGMHDR